MSTQKIQLAINAPAADVWRALTDPAISPAYYYGFEAHIPAVAGAAYSYLMDGHEVITGTVTDVVEEERLSMTFRGSWAPDVAELPESRVTYVLSDTAMSIPGLTQLTLIHEGLPEGPTSENIERGWVLILSGLKTLLETSAPLVPAPTA
ncbi:SRPBCC domain-containing protein [Microbacterium invictum]|uniref:SRPBCC domain-containing protein n=1 Tax=Microbacterium invictum TaxID=515415 RepID=A0ABZ0VF40_9MICO|nr:SRPBCC domain-containing protein [Microbacterium invictum]WQB71135.1 SRPBCC domain-containing protein [Microbacterium invictum]